MDIQLKESKRDMIQCIRDRLYNMHNVQRDIAINLKAVCYLLAAILGCVFVIMILMCAFVVRVNAAPSEQEMRDCAFGTALNYDISPHLVIALIETESRFVPNVNSHGLMQINPDFQHARMKKLDITDISDPYQNIHLGVDYLHDLFVEYEDVGVVLNIYNAGPSILKKSEQGYLSPYTRQILERAEELEHNYIYGEDDSHG